MLINSPKDGAFTAPSTPSIIRARAMDSAFTMDAATMDSVGTFFIEELERLDPTLHEPLVMVSWGRDIDLREDVGVSDDLSSFTRSAFGSTGGINPAGKNWISAETTAIPAAQVDIDKIAQPLREWGSTVQYTYRELEKGMRLGRPIDAQKLAAMHMKHQMDIDEMVYIGEPAFQNTYGMLNNPATTVSTASAAGSGGGTSFASKLVMTNGAELVQNDILEFQANVWAASGWKMIPSHILMPPDQYALLNRTVSSAGTQSILEYIRVNNTYTQSTGERLEIQPVKWCIGRGTNGTDRMFAYTKDINMIRYPLVPLQKTPITYQDMWLRTTYWSLLGQVEFVYPETTGAMDGI
ncbi:DUF2184 domain-containing protein [Komagataeibacter oboediens]|uniref:DUF2184 domain-containing protein n=1 Tax=Komagataeibacter oboediens TaxID=65958 RepID=UPI000237EC98|nr:DUF2184 domain-containing protein [Komagataeibacter oboediens]